MITLGESKQRGEKMEMVLWGGFRISYVRFSHAPLLLLLSLLHKSYVL